MEKFKCKSLNFRGCSDSRMLRAIKKDEARKSIRHDEIQRRRGVKMTESVILEESQISAHNDVKVTDKKEVDPRRLKLMKWKEERELLKKLGAAKKKPIFKITQIAHEKTPRLVSRDIAKRRDTQSKNTSRSVLSNTVPAPSRPTTRSVTATNKKASSNGPAKCNKSVATFTAKPPHNQKENKVKSKNGDKATGKENPKTRKSFAPDNFQFFAPGNLVSFNWEPTPLTPRSSRQFVFTNSSENERPCEGRSSSTPKIDQKKSVFAGFDSLSVSKIEHSNASFVHNNERPKVLRMPVKNANTDSQFSLKYSKAKSDENSTEDLIKKTCSQASGGRSFTPKNSIPASTRVLRSSVAKKKAASKVEFQTEVSKVSALESNPKDEDSKDEKNLPFRQNQQQDQANENKITDDITPPGNSNGLSSKYFLNSALPTNEDGVGTAEGNRVTAVSKENTSLHVKSLCENTIPKEGCLVNLGTTPVQNSKGTKSKLIKDDLKLTEGISKLEISSVPTRVLRSNMQRVSLLYSPAPAPKSNGSKITSDLMSFSPAPK